jgi:uncharacterized protein involved in response to NO
MFATAAALLLWIIVPTSPATGVLFLGVAVLLALRITRWEGVLTLREPLLLVLHIGYAFLPLGFLLGAISILWPSALMGSAALHAWTVGSVGLMTLGVMTRATRGHTGREQTASWITVVSFAAMFIAACLRVGAGVTPQAYITLLTLSAGFWIIAFILFLIEYGPMLLHPRQGPNKHAA